MGKKMVKVGGVPAIAGVEFTAVGVTLPDKLNLKQWREIGGFIRRVEGGIQWWVGDWLRHGERRYGEKYKGIVEELGYAYQTLVNQRNVAQKFETNRRRLNLSWKHHAEVAGLDAAEQDKLLDKAEAEGWTCQRLREEVTNEKRAKETRQAAQTGIVTDLNVLVEEGRTFGTIYADPPWPYSNQATRGSTGNHYKDMTLDTISAMPIERLAADKAHLHLWTTNAHLFEAAHIIEAWGFTYKSCFIWVKPQIGMGNYWRVSHEFLLLGVRGSLTFTEKNLPSWVELPRERHSKKPEAIRALIEGVSPPPRLELFGRKTDSEWVVFGNQVERRLI